MALNANKIFYSMGEVSEMFDVNPSLIRYWESKFPILSPGKNSAGKRTFTEKDIENLKVIYHLVKEKGMTLDGAQKQLRENKSGIKRDMEIVEKLHSIRAMLMDIRQELKDGPGLESEIEEEQAVEFIMAATITQPTPQPSVAMEIADEQKSNEIVFEIESKETEESEKIEEPEEISEEQECNNPEDATYEDLFDTDQPDKHQALFEDQDNISADEYAPKPRIVEQMLF